MHLIQTTHLKTWAGSKTAENRFPHIVKALIGAVVQPAKLRMPSGDAVWVPGFDGVVVNDESNRFVPVGESVWELGTDFNFKGKANGDYQKRSFDGPTMGEGRGHSKRPDRSGLKFVFVTPLVWKDKEDWIEDRKKENIWQDVIVMDGVDLQDWLEGAPAVNLQFAAELGLVPETGLQTPAQAWEEWSGLTDPPASEELVVAGREQEEKELLSRLIAPPTTFTVRGGSPREAWGFALATIRRVRSEHERQLLDARLVVADNEEVAGRLRNRSNLIIMLKQAKGPVSGFLTSQGTHVVVPEGNDAQTDRNVIVLNRPTHKAFFDALNKMGLPGDEAERTTRSCGLSVTVFQRLNAHSKYERPGWFTRSNVSSLLPALLAGRWSDSSEADRETIRKLADAESYEWVEDRLIEFLSVDEAPLLKIGDMWTLTAPVDSFQLIARMLASGHLVRFKQAFRDVFGAIDPKLDIPPSEWLSYDMKGPKGHSGWLRAGMAETLLLIAERGRDAMLRCVPSPQGYADDVVRGLPGLDEDWRALISIRDQYPRIIEATPDPLLDSLELLLEAKPDESRRLFIESDSIFGGPGLQTGLLWGLETLAWSPEYLSRVSVILAKLVRVDPGGRWANRPINSLRNIFLWWHPGSNASLDQRLASIDLIISEEPEVGGALLEQLLPAHLPSIAHPTMRPRWRDFGDISSDARTRTGQSRYLSGIVDRTIEHLGAEPRRWVAVLDILGMIAPIQREKFLELLEAIAKGSSPTKDSLWEPIREFIHKHRSYQGASWALPSELLDRIEAILALLAPTDPIGRNKWLFDDWLPDLPAAPTRSDDANGHALRMDRLRQQAVNEILTIQGAEGLVTLGSTCKYPVFAASAAVSVVSDLDDLFELVQKSISAGEEGISFAGQLSGHALRLNGKSWSDLILKEARAGTWNYAVVAGLLLWWPDGWETWNEVTALGDAVEAHFWRQKPVLAIGGPTEDRVHQVESLIAVGRSIDAFSRISLQPDGIPTETLLRLFDAVLGHLAQPENAARSGPVFLHSHHIISFLNWLRNDDEVPRIEVARREYQALPLLGTLHARGLTLHEFMVKDSSLFIDLVCAAFLPAHRDRNEDHEATPQEQSRAMAAYTLLEQCDRIPALTENGTIDEAGLLEWITQVRGRAVEVDRATVVDERIGQILAHSSVDPEDGCWPLKAIRAAIETIKSDAMDEGLRIGRFNMRGVVSKDLYEGGDQERSLADQYRKWARIAQDHWPRTARLLGRIAAYWTGHAQQEDERAEQDKLS